MAGGCSGVGGVAPWVRAGSVKSVAAEGISGVGVSVRTSCPVWPGVSVKMSWRALPGVRVKTFSAHVVAVFDLSCVENVLVRTRNPGWFFRPL